MKINLRAIVQAITAATKSVLDELLRLYSNFVAIPFRLAQSAVGIGAAQRIPENPPEFDVPVSPTDLVLDLNNGHARNAAVRDLDRDGINTVFKFAKLSKHDRAIADLSNIEREDVRRVLLQMTTSELEALTKAGSGAVRRLIVDGDAKVWGVPSVVDDLAVKLRVLKERMAKPAGAYKPCVMPKMPKK